MHSTKTLIAAALGSALLAAAPFAVAAQVASSSPSALQAPALVGFQCEGASGPLYVAYEDELPRCERIERVALPASPDVLSIQFTDEATAVDFFNEAASLGERVCLDVMPADRGGVVRYWLHTCDRADGGAL